MSLPYQRTQSGRLRAARQQKDEPLLQRTRDAEVPNPGIENASEIREMNPDDEAMLYSQSPTRLADTQVDTLLRAARGLGIEDKRCVNRDWRCTWNIGRWKVGEDMYLSANVVQPNVSVMWANVKGVDQTRLHMLCTKYRDLRLESSKCEFRIINDAVQIQGRWVPYVLDEAVSVGLVKKENIDITYVNLSQSRLFFWLILDGNRRYFCTPTVGTIVAMSTHLPEWSKPLTEINAGYSLSIKLEALKQVEDASQLGRQERKTLTHLTVKKQGWIQLVGNDSNVESLYRALGESVRGVVESTGLTALMKSLEYSYPRKDSGAT